MKGMKGRVILVAFIIYELLLGARGIVGCFLIDREIRTC